MISIRNLLFLAVAVTGSVIKRDVATIKKDLDIINSDTQAVTGVVKNYNGGGVRNAFPILKAQQKLTNDIKTATNHAKGVKANEAEAKGIIRYITEKFEPNIAAALNALKAKKEKFKADGLIATVKHILETLRSDSSEYSEALIASTPGNQRGKAKGVKNDIIAKFDDAIRAFS